ncbi:MAG: pentapeptide repeat-containing protein [Acidimicrobiales bacterium]
METELEILQLGVDAWNEWRTVNPTVRPSLRAADLSGRDLSRANLSETDLAGADRDDVDLSRANLKMCDLSGADLAGADLAGADLYKADLANVFGVGATFEGAYLAESCLAGADLRGAAFGSSDLTKADLSTANLVGADLGGADMSGADIRGADVSQANVAGASVYGLQYGSFMTMSGHYFAVRGLDSCYGNALFTRDARDQDYLDSMRRSMEETPSPWKRKLKLFAFSAWSVIDFGRSLAKPAVYALTIAMLFGVLYTFDRSYSWGMMDYSGSADTPLSPFYYSIVTYTTLGFGDITPVNWVGEIVVVSEVIMGYTTLGLLLSILANRVARQS